MDQPKFQSRFECGKWGKTNFLHKLCALKLYKTVFLQFAHVHLHLTFIQKVFPPPSNSKQEPHFSVLII